MVKKEIAEAGVVRVLVDDRERNHLLFEALRKIPGVLAEAVRLPLGDFRLGNLIVERKTISDLAASVKDGRLFRQGSALAASRQPALIILEGNSSAIEKSGLKREAIQGALLSMALVYGIPLLRSLSPEETIHLILLAEQQIRRTGWRQGLYPRAHTTNRANQKLKQQIYLLQGLPGVGPKRAKLLLEKFGSLSAIFNAMEHDIATIPGMGKRLAKRISEIIHLNLT